MFGHGKEDFRLYTFHISRLIAMSDHDLETLLGGFAADTLTPEEKARVYSAALHDQQLFDALADEQALKELLADPAVRRRLLHTLNQTGTSGTATWGDWFRRPSGLAWAGGLAAAVCAVVLGTKLYQDSLKHAAQSVTTEETRPATPPVPTPSLSQPEPSSISDLSAATQSQDPLADNAARNNVPLNQVMKREQAPAPASRERRTSDRIAGLEKGARGQKNQASHTTPLSETLDKAATSSEALPRQKQIPHAPAASSLPQAPLPPPSKAMEAAGTVPTVSARALFFGNTGFGTASGMRETEQEQPGTPIAESMPQAGKPERTDRVLPQQALVSETGTSTKPLGLRYSFMIQGADGRNREVSPSIASGHKGPLFLTVESNQEAYVQIWAATDSTPPQLLLPMNDGGNTALKLFTGQRHSVLLPITGKPSTIVARIARIPLGPTLEEDSSFETRPGPHILQETVTAIAGTPQQEEATYTVNQDPSVNQLTVSFPFPAP